MFNIFFYITDCLISVRVELSKYKLQFETFFLVWLTMQLSSETKHLLQMRGALPLYCKLF